MLTRRTGCGSDQQIMGLFEYCERLLEQGLLKQTDFDRNLRYRLMNIVANSIIV